MTPAQPAATADTEAPDPYLWLEDVEGERALAWARARSAETERQLQSGAGFDEMKRSILEVLDSKEQIPYVTRRGGWLYNFWRDAANPRGLWRRTTLAEFRKAQPAWETLLDVDALGRAEGENWVWAGASCLGPAYRRCLVSLSRGGADAHVVREFDTEAKAFVDGGFAVAEAKTSIDWLNADQVMVATDFGPGSLTESGYPRIVKRWLRGQALADAKTVFEAEVKDVAASFSVDLTPGFERTVVGREIDFYHSRQLLVQGDRLVALDKPDDAQIGFHREHVAIELRSDWTVGGVTWPRGSLLVGSAAAFLQGKREFTALFTPTATRSLASFTATRGSFIVNVLDQVASRLEEWTPDADAAGGWRRREVHAPFPGSLSVDTLHDALVPDDPLAEAYWLNAADFLSPDSLQLGRSGSDERELLKSRPSFYDAAGMRVEQRFATSKDGTRVPYFVVWPQDAGAEGGSEGRGNGAGKTDSKAGNTRPTLLYGYGGFEVSLTPTYSGVLGRAWTGRGGVYVQANIRGGGEFGPAWHQAALRENKQKSYDDFAAVAEDLIAAGITTPAQLGIQGGSNGGLLVGAVMLQRPELFKAVVCQVPLLDMRRYHLLLAGASWMAEYGDPDDPAQWATMSRWSPYQNVRPGLHLPTVLFATSTRDDRVHPGHARKMAARMIEQGHDVLYWENIEGGHGGAADNSQRAQMLALEYTFLWQQLQPGR